MSNIVAIIGRPNVGKSTFFNRITESRQAIVDEIAGVTRDRHYGKGDWNGKQFTLIDTGGYVEGSDDVFEDEIRKQVEIAIQEANVLLFMVDVTTGITDYDEAVADLIRRSRKKVFVVVNKVDNSERQSLAPEFYKLGLGELYNISAISGAGTGELLDDLVKVIEVPQETEEEDVPRIAIVGRPNVGKSSLTNALLGQERNIVTDIAGTTRDSINTRYKFFGHDFILIDTAGIRKKSKVREDLEFYSVMRSVKAIENCDVVVLMIDATLGLESQDLNIFHLAERNRKGIVIVVNKWDLVENKETNSIKEYEAKIKKELAPFVDVPIVFVSVLTKQRILKVMELARDVFENKNRKISTKKLNDVMLPIIDNQPPPTNKGKDLKIKFVTQLPGKNPNFAFYCNLPQYVRESYIRFLENKIRANFIYTGVPIEVVLKKKV